MPSAAPAPTPAEAPPLPSRRDDATRMLALAREIAADLRTVNEILEIHKVTTPEWERIRTNPQFTKLLQSCIEEWNSAGNTPERIKLKSLIFIEEALPEFYSRAHDPKETLTAKTEVLKTVSRLAGVGGNAGDQVNAGERMVVTINLGADHQLKIEKEVTSKVIEGDTL